MSADLQAFKASGASAGVGDIPALCAAINGTGMPKDREALFTELLAHCLCEDAGGLVGNACVDATKAVLDGVLSESVQLVVSRAVLGAFAAAAERCVAEVVDEGSLGQHEGKAFCQIGALAGGAAGDRGRSAAAKQARGARLVDAIDHAVAGIAARNNPFEEADLRLRRALALHHHDEEEWGAAAAVLAGATVENASTQRAEADLAMFYTEVAEYYLQAEDELAAERMIGRAAQHAHHLKPDGPDANHALYRLRYLVSHARILDSKRKFLDAARRYYELSHSANSAALGLDTDDLQQLLDSAITCAILAPAGPQRTRLLAMLCKDVRVEQCEHGAVLLKMYREQLLKGEDLRAFEAGLQEHQRATGGDGLTVLRRATIEHNMIGASKIYTTIRFAELGALLEIGAEQAEKITATMVTTGRLKGTIDQIDGVLEFEGSGSEVLLNWDGRISQVCNDMDACLESIAATGIALEA